MTVSPARVGLAESRPQPQRSASSIGPAAFDHMIQEPVGQPGELHIVAGQRPPPPPAAPGPGSALRAQPQTGTPARATPAVLLLQANELDIETGIAVMRQRGLPQDAAERAVGLPAGVLSAVVDGQGRWLDEQAQSGAAVGLPAEQLQQLALLLGRMRDHLQDLPAQAVQVSASSSSPMRPLQEHELDDFIHEMSQQIEPVRARKGRAKASGAMVQDIASRYPQEHRESKTAWAKRIHAGEAPLRARPFEERIAVLKAVTGAYAYNLRKEPVLQDVDPNLESLARVIKARMPQEVSEGPAAYALRIYKRDGDVRAMSEVVRIAVLAIATGAREDSLRKMSELCDIPASKISLVQGIRSRVPHKHGEGRGVWARRIHREDAHVQDLPYPERITALALVTGMREADLRCIPSLENSGSLVRQAENVRQRTPRGDGESGLSWARRIYKNDFSVRSLTYSDRIDLLAAVTDVIKKDLRKDSMLKDRPGGGLRHFVSRTLGGSSVSRHPTLDSPTSSTRPAATSPDLSSLRSEIPEDSFRTVAEGLSLTNHINNLADLEAYSNVSAAFLNRLVFERTASDGSTRLQLTSVGEAYLNRFGTEEQRHTLSRVLSHKDVGPSEARQCI
ncbi:MAG: hypothetical protein JF606_17705 [Burkholderiales bacterium]|nr:hypothetical protein [Burkholderiales bacterium]